MFKLSKRSSQLRPSPLAVFFRRVTELRHSGKNIISLGIGEPEAETPAVIRQAGITAIEEGNTRYIPVAGSRDVREILAKKYGALPEEVFVSHGAKSVLGIALQCLLDQGDEVLIAAPYYPPFLEIVKFLSAKPVLVDTLPDGFRLTVRALREVVDGQKLNPCALVINSPNNPTSVAYDRAELELIMAFAKERGITVVSDECYSNFAPDRQFTFRQVDPSAVVINSASKTYAMTGWRIGWAVGPKELVDRMILYADNFVGCPGSVSERAVVEALSQSGIPDVTTQRAKVHSWLEKMGIEHVQAISGFYVFANFSRFMQTSQTCGSVALANHLLEEANVAVTPGVAFGEAYDEYLRLSFPLRVEDLEIALAKLEKALNQLR
ncbi:aminotransferase class I/II-fold pyridoxal phosphate-dependent enzyme [Patescibacteria group bacterium]|nr:MAG: aminotransferase class I/II-fold pyridoxal phosphate-dependent enzyme [Patescibacteria group bacterium]